MASARPDIVCMQECLKPGTTNSQELAADLGLDVTDDSLSPGLAIASRLPMRSVEPLSAFRVDWHGKAKPLHAILTAGSTDVSVVCVHVPLDRFGPRDELFAELASWQSPVGFTILVGDFNAVPSGPEIGMLVAAGYEDVSIESGPTMPNPDPVAKLDYVFARGGPNGLSASADAMGLDADEDGYLPSDHAGVIVELAWPSATALPSPHSGPSSEIDL